MLFSQLAKYLQKLEKTASRNEITKILAEVFKEADGSEIDKICYLLLGRIEPQYTGVEFNFAERMMIRAMAVAYTTDGVQILGEYKKVGDLGDTAYEQSKSKYKSKNKLSVEEVYNRLHALAVEGGKDSQERKLKAMADLLKVLDPLSAKYIVRIPLGKLRLGFADVTMLDALSVMEVGDKSARKKIEGAYNVLSDIGEIAKRVKGQEGLRGLAEVHAAPGVPVRTSLAERLPSTVKIIEKLGPLVAVEPKMDGFRCIGGLTPIYTREKGYISVKSIKVGDYVLTHKGRFKKVIAINKRVKDKMERVFKFQTYLGNGFRISEGHQMLVWREGKLSWVPVESVDESDEVVFPRPCLFSKKSGLFPNPHLVLRDESGYTKTIQTGEDFYRFLGFWIGDGFTNEYHNTERVGLLFNAKTEGSLAREYEQIVRKTLGISHISNYTYGGTLSVYWRDKPLKAWLTTYFRREWRGKMLPYWFSEINKENFLAFLKGWVESDGTPRHGGGFRITTKERDLAMVAQLIGASHGIILGVRKVRLGIAKNGFKGTYYEVIVPGTKRRARVVGDKLFIRVLHKEQIARPDPRMTFYNLQVEDDESYCTGMVALHNCQIHIARKNSNKEVIIFSRNHENITAMFPEIVEAAKKLKLKTAIFDGEAIGYDPKTQKFALFQQTVQRKRKHEIDSKAVEIPLKVFVFDVLYLNGKDMISMPFRQRRKVLEDVIGSRADTVMLTRQILVDKPEQIRAAFEEYIAEGLEGVMAKKLDAPYQAGGRGFHWVKYKKHTEGELSDTIDCVLMGAYRGRGKRAKFGVGGFLLGVPGKDNKYYTLSNLGTGLSDEAFRKMYKMVQDLEVSVQPGLYVVDKMIAPDIWVKPKVVLEILADEITLSPRHTAGRNHEGRGYSLRFPRLIRVREDKDPDQATSVLEVETLYKMQGK